MLGVLLAELSTGHYHTLCLCNDTKNFQNWIAEDEGTGVQMAPELCTISTAQLVQPQGTPSGSDQHLCFEFLGISGGIQISRTLV